MPAVRRWSWRRTIWSWCARPPTGSSSCRTAPWSTTPPWTRRRREANPRDPDGARGPARLPARAAPVGALGHHDRVLAVRARAVRARRREPPPGAARGGGAGRDRRVRPSRHADRDGHAGRAGHRGVSRSAVRRLRARGQRAGARPPRAVARDGAQSTALFHRGQAQAGLPGRGPRQCRRRAVAELQLRGRRALRSRLGGEAGPAARARRRRRRGGRRGLRRRRRDHHRHHDPDGRAAAQPGDRDHAARGRDRRVHSPPVPAPGRPQGAARGAGRRRLVLRRLRVHQPVLDRFFLLHGATGAGRRGVRDGHRADGESPQRRATFETSMNRGRGTRDEGRAWIIAAIAIVLVTLPSSPIPLFAQRPTLEQQMRDNQQRLEGIRRERTQAQQDLERLRAQVHSLADELTNLEHQKETTNRIVNELDRQILQLGDAIDRITVDLVLAQDALDEKRAVAERRLVDIYKRGPLYAYQVLFAAESFGDLLSRYKYLYLISRQDRQLANEMNRLRDRIARERRGLVEARDALERRRTERSEELQHFVDLASQRQRRLRETRRDVERVQERLTATDAEERRVANAIATLERARREAEARGAVPTTGAITSGSLGSLDWPVP